jgi:hypothetical protein
MSMRNHICDPATAAVLLHYTYVLQVSNIDLCDFVQRKIEDQMGTSGVPQITRAMLYTSCETSQ